MGCDARDPEFCLHGHVRPWLTEPKVTDRGDGYSAIAPCHDDTSRSLSVSVGARRAIVWNCFACKDRLGNDMAQIRTRSALIRAGVPARCLPLTKQQSEAMVDQFRDILHADLDPAVKVFRLAVLTECGGDMPAGGELKDLVEWSGVSQATGYRARRASTDNL